MKTVAIVFASENESKIPAEYRGTSYRVCEVYNSSGEYVFKRFIDGESWQNYSSSSVIAITSSAAEYAEDNDLTYLTRTVKNVLIGDVSGEKGNMDTIDALAIIYKPSGRQSTPTNKNITVIEGTFDNNGILLKTNTANKIKITSSWLTGRNSYDD